MAFESFTSPSRTGASAQRYAISFSAAACVLVGILVAGQQVKAEPPPKEEDPVDVKFTEEIPEEKPKEEDPPPPPEPASAPAPLVPAMIKTNPLPPPPDVEPPPDKIPDKTKEGDPSKDPGAFGSGSGEPGGTGTGGGGGIKKEIVPPPPPPPPQPPPPKQMVAEKPAEGDAPAKAITAPKPAYPDSARAAGIQGVVIVKITIDDKGNVTSAKIVKGDPNFDEVVMKAVLGWKFEPAKHADGTAFASTKTLKFPFKLSG